MTPGVVDLEALKGQPTPAMRRHTVCCVVVVCFQQACAVCVPPPGKVVTGGGGLHILPVFTPEVRSQVQPGWHRLRSPVPSLCSLTLTLPPPSIALTLSFSLSPSLYICAFRFQDAKVALRPPL